MLAKRSGAQRRRQPQTEAGPLVRHFENAQVTSEKEVKKGSAVESIKKGITFEDGLPKK